MTFRLLLACLLLAACGRAEPPILQEVTPRGTAEVIGTGR